MQQTITGVVLKQYAVFGQDKKVLMAKHVSEAFKEKHSVQWKASNPKGSDITDSIIEGLKTDARWNKTIQHLRDAGELENEPRDIAKLMKELSVDTLKEEQDHIKDILFKWAWPKINRGIAKGFPEYYKDQLARSFGVADQPCEYADSSSV